MHLKRCIADLWHWWWLPISLDFAGFFNYLVVDWLESKGGLAYS